jgi:hypothetical protein
VPFGGPSVQQSRVALIFGEVCSSRQSFLPGQASASLSSAFLSSACLPRACLRHGDETRVVASGHGVEAQHVGPTKQHIELQMPIAFDAGVRRHATSVGVQVRTDHMLVELVTEVEHVVVNVERVRDAASVIDIGNRTASRIALSAPQFHRDAHDLMALLDEQRCGDGAVHTPRHGDHDAAHRL